MSYSIHNISINSSFIFNNSGTKNLLDDRYIPLFSFNNNEKNFDMGVFVETSDHTGTQVDNNSIIPSVEWIKKECGYGGYTIVDIVHSDIDLTRKRESFNYIKYYNDTFSQVPVSNLPPDYKKSKSGT